MRVIINFGKTEGSHASNEKIQEDLDTKLSPAPQETLEALDGDPYSADVEDFSSENEEESFPVKNKSTKECENTQYGPNHECQKQVSGSEAPAMGMETKKDQSARFSDSEQKLDSPTRAKDASQSPILRGEKDEIGKLPGSPEGSPNTKPSPMAAPTPNLPVPSPLSDLPAGSQVLQDHQPPWGLPPPYCQISSSEPVGSGTPEAATLPPASGSGKQPSSPSSPVAKLKEDSPLPPLGSAVGPSAGSTVGRKRPRPGMQSQDSVASVEIAFLRALKLKGWELKEEEGDGNCLFRAVSTHIYGDAGMHSEIRHKCTEFMSKEAGHYSRFVAGDFNSYIAKLRQDGVFGSNLEIQCMTELFNRPIEIYVPENGATPINIFHGSYKTGDMPIRLSYHGGNHYNSIVNPKEATVGLGLGIPAMLPDAAEKDLMEKTLYHSQIQQIDQVMKNKILAISDWEQTELELEKAAIAASLEDFSGSARPRPRSQPGPSKPPSAHQNHSRVAKLKREDPSPHSSPGSGSSSRLAIERKLKRHRPRIISDPTPSQQHSDTVPQLQTVVSPAPMATAEAHAMEEEVFDPYLYPESVQEMLFNGFPLKRVLHAYELVGDSSDDMLMVLMSSSSVDSPTKSC